MVGWPPSMPGRAPSLWRPLADAASGLTGAPGFEVRVDDRWARRSSPTADRPMESGPPPPWTLAPARSAPSCDCGRRRPPSSPEDDLLRPCAERGMEHTGVDRLRSPWVCSAVPPSGIRWPQPNRLRRSPSPRMTLAPGIAQRASRMASSPALAPARATATSACRTRRAATTSPNTRTLCLPSQMTRSPPESRVPASLRSGQCQQFMELGQVADVDDRHAGLVLPTRIVAA